MIYRLCAALKSRKSYIIIKGPEFEIIDASDVPSTNEIELSQETTKVLFSFYIYARNYFFSRRKVFQLPPKKHVMRLLLNQV